MEKFHQDIELAEANEKINILTGEAYGENFP